MGKKKAQVMQGESGTSFLAGQVQPSPATPEVIGIQANLNKLEELVKVYDYMLYKPIDNAIKEVWNKGFIEELVSALWQCKVNEIPTVRPALCLIDDHLVSHKGN